jgi:hypothetical protein
MITSVPDFSAVTQAFTFFFFIALHSTRIVMTLARHIIAGCGASIRTSATFGPRTLCFKDARQVYNSRIWFNGRHSTTAATQPQSSRESTTEEQRLIYSAPNAPTVKLLKMFSISSFGVIDRLYLSKGLTKALI